MRYLRGTYTPRYVGGCMIIIGRINNDKAHVSFLLMSYVYRKKEKEKEKKQTCPSFVYPIPSYPIAPADFG